MVLVGLDIGTTGCKACVFDGDCFSKTYYETYPCLRNNNQATIDIVNLKKSVIKVISDAIKENPNIDAIGVTSFGEAFVLLDENEEILYDCMLYSDVRGKEEALELKKIFGDKYLKKVTGQIANPTLSINKICYVKKHYPEIFAKTKKIMLIEDYIVYILSGVQQIDYSLAARTQCFDIYKKAWDEKMLNKLGISSSLFSKPVKTGAIAGNLKADLFKDIKLEKEIKIINVSQDQIANLMGSGASKIGDAADGIGTCECLTPIFENNADVSLLADYGFGMIPSYFDETYSCYGFTSTAGACNEWFIKTFNSSGDNIQGFEYFGDKIEEKPTNLFFLPYFSGSGTPYNDVENHGSIVGLNLSTTREEIYQSILESLCFENKLNMELLKKAKVNINEVFVTGGGSQVDKWMQLKANILNVPVHQVTDKNAGIIGCIVIMLASMGDKANIGELVKKLNPIKKTYLPNKEINALYEKRYAQYVKLYKTLKKEGF